MSRHSTAFDILLLYSTGMGSNTASRYFDSLASPLLLAGLAVALLAVGCAYRPWLLVAMTQLEATQEQTPSIPGQARTLCLEIHRLTL